MATLNDFKLLKVMALNHFTTACNKNMFSESVTTQLSDLEKQRFGFYYLVISQIIDNEEYDEITEMISDTYFNSKLFGHKFEDEGVDAVYFEDEGSEKVIHIFNFKYREKFNSDAKQSENDALLSLKFLSAIKSGNTKSLKGKTKDFAQQIIEKNSSNELWNTVFHIVSNENNIVDISDPTFENFASVYSIKINPVGINEVMKYFSLNPYQIDAKLMLKTESVMKFSEDPLLTKSSVIINLSLSELIRITCNNEELRQAYDIRDIQVLSDVDIDYNVLFDNVRGYIVRSKFNKNIEATLEESPLQFFYFNNGITIVADNVEVIKANSEVMRQLCIKNFQVLNGGQTLRTIHKFNQSSKRNIAENLSKARVLVKVLNISDSSLRYKIGEYTNSQNSIDSINLASLKKEQLDLELFLRENNIKFIRKKGDIGKSEDSSVNLSITLERLGQLLLASSGKPEEISNKKKDIFTKYYEELYSRNKDLLTINTIQLIKSFEEIRSVYKSTNHSLSVQKYMYILYLKRHLDNSTLDLINDFEDFLTSYKKDNDEIAHSRKLISNSFKKALDKKMGIIEELP